MKIAFDFHGVLESYPDKFKPLLKSLRSGNEVIILSGPPYDQIKGELSAAGYYLFEHYDEIISVVDWIKSKNIKMKQHQDGSWYCSDGIWWSSKALICEQFNIEILFDDKIEYDNYINEEKTLFMHVK